MAVQNFAGVSLFGTLPQLCNIFVPFSSLLSPVFFQHISSLCNRIIEELVKRVFILNFYVRFEIPEVNDWLLYKSTLGLPFVSDLFPFVCHMFAI